MTVYVVHHVHPFDDGSEDVKLIGVYSSLASATAAVARLKLQPGFADHPAGFHIDPFDVDKDHWTEGFVTEP